MQITKQVLIFTFLFIGFGLSFPTDSAALDVDAAEAEMEASNLQVDDVLPNLLALLKKDLGIEEEAEEHGLEKRADDPFHGAYAPSPSTRKKELENIRKGLSPDGRTGRQVSHDLNVKYDGQSGKDKYLEILNGGPLPKDCGTGCQNSIFSKASKAAQLAKAKAAGCVVEEVLPACANNAIL